MTQPHDEETGSYVSSSEDEEEVALNPEEAAGREEDWDEWQGDDTDEDATKSLFGQERLPNPEAAMEHDASKYGFDIRQFAIQERLDEYGIIRVINYIRSEVAAGRDPLPALASTSGRAGGGGGAAAWSDDRYLVPAMEDDALLFYDFEEVAAAAAAAAGSEGAGPSGSGAGPGAGAATTAAAEASRLREENAALRAALEAMRQAFLPEELREADTDASTSAAAVTAAAAAPGADWGAASAIRAAEPTSSAAAAPEGQPEAAASAAAADPEAAAVVAAASAAAAETARRVDAAYFDSYSYFDIHREMLGDKPRTEAYRDALERNPSLLRGARVLDVGCGTGILSLFACRAGAARVVAVDGSERIAGFARRHAELAGYADSDGGPMSVVCGKLEELDGKLPVQQVDVIVSEWMGYALLFETMLDTVLHARDKYLRPGGAVLPDRALIYIAGASSAAGGLGFWRDVYGFNMTPVAEAIAEAGRGQAVVLDVKKEHLITSTACVRDLDLCTMRPEDQDFTADFRLEALPAAEAGEGQEGQAAAAAVPGTAGGEQEVGAIALWFDTAFSSRHCAEHPVLLSTSPLSPPTHWAQTLLTLRRPVRLAPAGGGAAGAAGGPPTASVISGRLSVVRSRAKHRSLDIGLQYRAEMSDGSVVEEAQLYHMSVTAPS
ncbi:hypothetical protein GPECTOR_2g1072 [Gonium pectorale]|uniref:type I protein arginine methyltransferase n=1 Tax=Gonium pectorale TaxID=33097 RepID=A0A150H0J6_GONPE|nr:hypothetical protein GPECTOR_2g1072 [Gonium pectorale]|eukprot:KXZ55523.1 hypothetical protein GPECTOR_2g1072 [Gonium pectorale]